MNVAPEVHFRTLLNGNHLELYSIGSISLYYSSARVRTRGAFKHLKCNGCNSGQNRLHDNDFITEYYSSVKVNNVKACANHDQTEKYVSNNLVTHLLRWSPTSCQFNMLICVENRFDCGLKQVMDNKCNNFTIIPALREESSLTNVILQYKLLAAIFSAVWSVIPQS